MSHILEELFNVIENRKNADPETSYVASLYAKGTGKIAQKVGEEAFETVIEAMKNNPVGLKQESADLLFHLMVLWADRGITPDEVFTILEKRLGVGGIDEKNSRSQ